MRTVQISYLILCVSVLSCISEKTTSKDLDGNHMSDQTGQYITVLGIAQDAGYPQIDCEKACCKSFYQGLEQKKLVSSLGLIDKEAGKKYIFDATPDLTEQTQELKNKHLVNGRIIDAVFLTHAHIGHYTGLMYFGFEAMGGEDIPVYVMPRMKSYLETNGPWSQLVSMNNIRLHSLKQDSTIVLTEKIKVMPFLVPHRDEFSETVGYRMEGSSKKVLYIPDIDKWHLWERDIVEEVKKVDYALIDATFFKDGEIPRPMNEVPHPFIVETTALFENESKAVKNKIYFIHFNHSNPALHHSHQLKDSIQQLGFRFARQGDVFKL